MNHCNFFWVPNSRFALLGMTKNFEDFSSRIFLGFQFFIKVGKNYFISCFIKLFKILKSQRRKLRLPINVRFFLQAPIPLKLLRRKEADQFLFQCVQIEIKQLNNLLDLPKILSRHAKHIRLWEHEPFQQDRLNVYCPPKTGPLFLKSLRE